MSTVENINSNFSLPYFSTLDFEKSNKPSSMRSSRDVLPVSMSSNTLCPICFPNQPASTIKITELLAAIKFLTYLPVFQLQFSPCSRTIKTSVFNWYFLKVKVEYYQCYDDTKNAFYRGCQQESSGARQGW